MADPKGYQYHKDIMLGRERKKHSDNIRYSLRVHGKEVKKELIRVTSTGPRSGRFYSYRGRKYQASAPGEAPAKRSGRLSSKFTYRSRPMELLIGNTAFADNGFNYARHLEEDMDRPYFISTIERLHVRLERDLQDLF